MDRTPLQIENDYAAQDKWKSYAQNNNFFVKLLSDTEITKQVIEFIWNAVYEMLKKQSSQNSKEIMSWKIYRLPQKAYRKICVK